MQRLLLILCLCLAAGATDPDPRELFERARMLAERNQNLPEAIRLFGRVVQLARGQRALAAEAQYRQGVLLQRVGNQQEAERILRAVVREFSDQPSVVRLARARLPVGGQSTETNIRRIWSGADVDSYGAPSPDGRFLSFVDWTTGDLAIRNLATGETRRITHKNRPWAESRAQANRSVFSPDGASLAYTWLEDGAVSEIRVARTLPSTPRVLYRAPVGEIPLVWDWSPDGRYVLAQLLRPPVPSALILITLADGAARILPTVDCPCGPGRFSRDGHYIAYNVLTEGSDKGDVSTISVMGDHVTPLIRNPANDSLIGWTPDGSRLLFASDRSGSKGIWSVRIRDGEAIAEPELIRPDIETGEPLGITKEGSLYYSLSTDRNEVYVTEIDWATLAVTGLARPASPRYAGNKRSPVWSPDGRHLAYLSWRGDSARLVFVTAQNGQEREVIPQLANIVRILLWHPGGESVLVRGKPADKPRGIYAIDINTGAATWFADFIDDRPAFSADARKMYFGSGMPGGAGIFARDLSAGETKTLYQAADPVSTQNPGLALSPDGRWLAIQLINDPKGSNSLAVLPEGGGQPRILVSQSGFFGASSFVWSPDSRRILYASRTGNRAEVWVVDAQGGTPTRLGLGMTGEMIMFKLNPDGKRLTFMVTSVGEEIWAMGNFINGGR